MRLHSSDPAFKAAPPASPALGVAIVLAACAVLGAGAGGVALLSAHRSAMVVHSGPMLLAPMLAFVMCFMIWPIINVFMMSTESYKVTKPNDRHFIGLENFVTVFTKDHPIDYHALKGRVFSDGQATENGVKGPGTYDIVSLLADA